jgi:hypothetical protein
MLGFIFRKAQATVDNAISQLVWGLLMAVPLLVAAGFATAALSGHLHKIYAPEIANLILAAGYAAVGLLVAAVYALRGAVQPAAEEAGEAEAGQDASEATGPLSDSDRDFVFSALSGAVPFAIPPVLAAVLRNLPLVLLIAVAAFILTRDQPAPEAGVGPAE